MLSLETRLYLFDGQLAVFFFFFIGDQKRRKKQRQVKETVVVFLRHKKGKTVWSKRQDGAYT